VDFAFAIGKDPLLPRPIHLQKVPSPAAAIDFDPPTPVGRDFRILPRAHPGCKSGSSSQNTGAKNIGGGVVCQEPLSNQEPGDRPVRSRLALGVAQPQTRKAM
jgi:hypothetical protein